MPYKKAGSISTSTESNGGYEKRFAYHAAVAATLMFLTILARFVIPKVLGVEAASVMDLSYLGFWIGAKVVWLWACVHLALHYRLSAAWGLWGLLFLIGVAVIVWAGIQKPKWDLAKARRPQKSSNYKGDPDSLY